MVTLNEMQFAGMIGMGLLSLTMTVNVPRRVAKHPVYGRARWLMSCGLALLSIQFLIQYAFNLREMGLNQAIFVNLLFFIPCTLSMSLAILYVQRQGGVKYNEWMVGWRLYALVAIVLIVTVFFDGVPFAQDSPALRKAEYFGAAVYLIIQTHYFVLHVREYRRLKRAISEYYDSDRNDLLRWMGFSIIIMALFALLVPVIMFTPNFILIPFSIAFFFMIYYTATSFHAYGISLDTQRVEEAEESMQTDEAEVEAEVGDALSEQDRQRVLQATDKWVADGGYLKPNLTLSSVADEMNLQRYLLKAWLRETPYGKLSTWLNNLRTEEAKRLMKTHPDWALDTVAEQCGFASRQYFHKIFHQVTGITPTKFQDENL